MNGAISRFQQRTISMVERRVCLDVHVLFGLRSYRVPYFSRGSRLSDGGNFSSMQMTTTSSLGGWYPINGRRGSSIIENARLKQLWRMTPSFSINVLGGLAATGGRIILACSQRSTCGRESMSPLQTSLADQIPIANNPGLLTHCILPRLLPCHLLLTHGSSS